MLTEKQEKFAQSYVLNNNATDAAKSAGYSDRSAYNQGYRLLQNDLIIERIEELSRELKTSVDVVAEIEDQYTFAKTNGHVNSAIKALELLSRVRGNKVEDGKNISKEELITLIVSTFEVLGKEQVEDMVKRCKFD
jgi:phage terminase small subunit